MELCDSARAGERRAGGDGRGRGGAARTPSPRLPTHALLLEAIPYPPLSRCRAPAAVKVTGQIAQHGTRGSGPDGQAPPRPAHVPAPRVQRDRAAGRDPASPDPGNGGAPSFPSPGRERTRTRSTHTTPPGARNWGSHAVAPARAVRSNRSRVLGGPPELGITRAPPEPFSPPKVSPPCFPGQQVSPTRAAPAPTCVRRGLHVGGPGRGAPTPGRRSRRPRCPVPSRARRAALAASPGLASQSLSPPRRRLPG